MADQKPFYMSQILAFLHAVWNFFFRSRITIPKNTGGPNSPDYQPVLPKRQPSNIITADQLIRYMELKGYYVDKNPGNGNIVYVSGADFDAKKGVVVLREDNRPDEWNDVRLIVTVQPDYKFRITFGAKASTSPGVFSTNNKAAKQLGGVANVVPDQYAAWKIGFHRRRPEHPALVQRAPVMIWRDANANFTRDENGIHAGIFGINQHGTSPGYSGNRVGPYSAGCLVGMNFAEHLRFIDLIKEWKCYRTNKNHIFVTTIVDGRDLFLRVSELT